MLMGQVRIRHLDDKVVDRLKKRAKEHGRSLQSEVKTILEEAVPDYEAAWKRMEGFRKRLKKSGRKFSDSAMLIREDRNH
jgi:plasmid stability protein